jgi:iron complex outermembrane receptor protein
MKHRKLSALLLSTAAVAVALPAWAQDGAAPAKTVVSGDGAPVSGSASGREGMIEEVIVTARRFAESQQDAPITLTTYTGAQLQARGVTEFTRLAQVTPGVGFDEFPKGSPRVWFRGVGGGGQAAGGAPSSVAFLDGVYLARPPMLGIDFYDMERIEVLKGPQGTLQGKNVVAGTMNFITNKPVDDFEGTAQLTVGEFGQKNANLMLNAPLGDGVAARLVLGAITNDGFRKTVTGRPLDDDNKLSARLQVRAKLAEGTFLLLSGDVVDQDASDASRFNVFVLPFTPGKGFADYDNPRIANPDRLGFTKVTTGGARAELSTDALGFATWTTTGSWRTLDYDTANDLDGTDPATNRKNGLPAAIAGLQVFGVEMADSYSFESRLASNGDGPVHWVGGLYYNRDEVHRERESRQNVTPATINRFIGDATINSYAAYGEAEYAFSSGLKVFAGGRYTQEKTTSSTRSLTGLLAAPTVGYDTANAPGVFEKGQFTYRVGVNYRANENIFAFATISTGFKSGVFQESPNTAALARTPTAPERATNYEAGVKTDWFDRRFRANISAFWMDYRDFQTAKTVPDATQGPLGRSVTVDTADATIKGVETEFIAAPTSWFDASVRYTYLHPYFTRFIQTSRILANGSPVFTDGAGNRLSRTPIHAVVADVGLTSDRSASWGWLRGQVTMDYQGDIFDNNINDFTEYRRSRTLWDASVTYNVNDRYALQVWGHNLTNKSYRIWQTNGGVYQFVQYGPPRQYGVTLRAAF